MKFERSHLLQGGWGEYAAVSPDGKKVAVASTGRLFLWRTLTEPPEMVLLPGYLSSPISWDPLEDLIHAGEYRIRLDPLTVISPPFDVLNLLSNETGVPKECLAMERAIWNPGGNRLCCQVITVPSRSPEWHVCDDISNAWLCFVDGNRGTFFETPKELPTFDTIIALAVNSKWLVTGDNSGIKIFDWETGALLQQYVQERMKVRSVSISPDGKRVAWATLDGDIYIWDPVDGHLKHLLHLECGEGFPCCLFQPRTGNLITGSGQDISLWRIDAQDEPIMTSIAMDEIVGLAVSGTGNTLVSASGTGGPYIEVFNLAEAM